MSEERLERDVEGLTQRLLFEVVEMHSMLQELLKAQRLNNEHLDDVQSKVTYLQGQFNRLKKELLEDKSSVG